MAAFGAKVNLTVNKENKTQFNADIQKMVKTLDISKSFKITQKEISRIKSDIQTELDKKTIYVKNVEVKNAVKIKNLTVDQAAINKARADIQTGINKKPITVKVGKFDTKSAINNVRKELQAMLKGLSIKNGVDISSLTNFASGGEKITKQLTAWAGQMKTLEAISGSLSKTYQSGLSGKNMILDSNALGDIQARYDAWNKAVITARNSQKELDDITYNNLQREGIAIQQKITSLQNAQIANEKATKAAQAKAAAEEKASRVVAAQEQKARERIALAEKELATTKQIATAREQIVRFYSANSRLSSGRNDVEFGAPLRKMIESLSTGTTIPLKDLKAIEAAYADIRARALSAGVAGRSMMDSVVNAYERFGGWSIVTRSLMALTRNIKQMITNVIDLDAVMTELRKVTNETDKTYQEFFDNASVRAKELGVTVVDTVNATADFARLGYSLEDAAQIADAALVYKNVGDGIEDINDASESIISTMQAFRIEADGTMGIVDKFNKVGNEFAISSGGIGEALLRSASALQAANNTLDESIALTTAANTIIQDPEKVGTTLKTISMYLRAAKTEAEEAGESTDGMAESTSKLRAEILALTGNKVDVMIDDDNFKSTYQILKELASVWGELTDVSQANIMEMIGGKRNANVVAALINNFDIAESAMLSAADSSGSALEENEKYLESINGKLNEFKVAFEDLSTAFFNSELVKGVVEFGTATVNSLTAIVELLGEVPTAISGITAAMATIDSARKRGKFNLFTLTDKENSLDAPLISKLGTDKGLAFTNDGMNTSANNMLALKRAGYGYADAIKAIGISFDSAQRSINTYNNAAKSSANLQNVVVRSVAKTDTVLAGYLRTLNGSKASLEGYLSYCNKAGIATSTFGIKTRSLTGSIQALGIGSKIAAIGVGALNVALSTITTLGVSLVISAIVSGLYKLSQASKEAKDKSNELRTEFQDFATTNKDNINTLKSLESEFATLSKGVTEYGENVSLSASDYKRYKEIVQDITDISPELIDGYDNENNRIANKNKLLERAIELQEEEYRVSLKRMATIGNTNDVLEGIAIESGDVREESINEAQNNVIDALSAAFGGGTLSYATIFENSDVMQAAGVFIENMSKNLDFKEAGFETQEEYTEAINKARTAVEEYGYVYEDIKLLDSQVSDHFSIVAQAFDGYERLSDESKALVERFVDSFTVEDIITGSGYDSSKAQEIRNSIYHLIDDLTPVAQEKLSNVFELKDSYTSGEITTKEYLSGVQNTIDALGNYGLHKKSLDIVSEMVDTESLKERVNYANSILDKIGSKSKFTGEQKQTIEDLLGNMTNAELSMLYESKDAVDDCVYSYDNLYRKLLDIKDESEVVINPATIADLLPELEALSDGFEKISEVYNDVLNKEDFNFGSLVDEDFVGIFGELDEYKDFVNIIAEAPDDIGKCQSAFNDLVSAWFYAKSPLSDINEETKNFVVQWLKAKGVANANEVAMYALAKSGNSAFAATYQLTDASEASISKLQQEANAAGYTGYAFEQLAVSIIKANQCNLDTSQQVEALYRMAQMARVASDETLKALSLQQFGEHTVSVMRATDDAQRERYAAEQGKTVDQVKYEQLVNWFDSRDPLNIEDFLGDGAGSGGSGGSSSSEAYKAEIDKYRELIEAVEEYDTKLTHLKQVYEHTDDIEDRIALKEEEIQLYHEQKQALDALNKARDEEIAQNVNELRGVGFDITYDPLSDNLKIKNIEHLNTLSQDQIKKYEDLIDKTYELNDANKDSAEQWTELTYSIADVAKEIRELRNERFDDVIADAEHVLKLMENRSDIEGEDITIMKTMMESYYKEIKSLAAEDLQANKDRIKELQLAWMEYYDKILDRQEEQLNNLLKDRDGALDAIIRLYDSEIDKIDQEIDRLNKINEERKESIELQKAEAALDAAKTQKVRRVLRDEEGWVYEADEEAIKEAEETLADLKFEETISSLESQKESLEKLSNMWSEIPDLFEQYQNELLAEQILGADWESDVLNGRLDAYNSFKDAYMDIQQELYDVTEEANKHMSEQYQEMMDLFQKLIAMSGSEVESPTTGKTGNKSWYVGKDGKAPVEAQVGDTVYTKGGTYEILDKDENGEFTSKKIDDVSTSIPEGLWGTEIKNGTADLTDVVGMNVLATEDIVRATEDQIEEIKNNILQNERLQEYMKNNTDITMKDVDAIMENIDYTDLLSGATRNNSDATDDNTAALRDLIYSIGNLELKELLEEEEGVLEEALKNFDDSQMSPEDQAYLKQIQAAWNAAKEQGNQELMDELHALADSIREQYINGTLRPSVDGYDYNRVGADGYSTVFHENSRSDAYGNGAQVAGIIGTTRSIWGLDSTNKKQVQEFVDRGLLTEDEAKNLVQLAGGNYDADGTKKSTYKGQDISGWDKQVISDNYSSSGETYWTKIKYTDPETGKTVTKQEANAYTKEQIDAMKASGNSTDKNTSSLNENTDSTTYAGDSAVYAGDSMTDAADTIVDGVKDAVSNIEVDVNVSGAGTSGGSGGSGGGSSSGGYKQLSSGDYSGKTVAAQSDVGGGYRVTRYTDGSAKVEKKKAKGGLNLPEDYYITHEIGDEMILDKPDEGNWVRINTGGSVIPADVSANLWKFGINPIKNVQDIVLKLLSGITFNTPKSTSETPSQTIISVEKVEMHGVNDVLGLMNELIRLPQEANQYGGVKTNISMI